MDVARNTSSFAYQRMKEKGKSGRNSLRGIRYFDWNNERDN